jgi:hypothetical protein
LDKDSPLPTIYAPTVCDVRARIGKGPARRAGPNENYRVAVLAIALLATVLSALTALLPSLATLLATLAGFLVLLTGVLVLLARLLLATALLLPGLLATLLLATLVRVLILAHRFLPWVPSPQGQPSRRSNVPRDHMSVVRIPPRRAPVFRQTRRMTFIWAAARRAHTRL